MFGLRKSLSGGKERAELAVKRILAATGEANTLFNLAWSEQAQGQTALALDHARQAVARLETVRANLGSLTQNKQSFLAKYLGVFYYCLHLLLRQSTQAATQEAFLLAQQTKARVLLDLLAGGKADFSRFLTDQDAFHLAQLQQTAQHANAQLLQAQLHSTDPQQIDPLRQQLQQSEQALQSFSDELLSRYPQLASRQPAKTLTLSQIAALLPADTALLEYVILQAGTGKQTLDETVLFCLTIQQGKPLLQVYSIARTQKQLAEQVSDFQAACSNPNRDYQLKAHDLYTLLLAPAEKQLAGKKRLLVCPDNVLWNLPFQALLLPSSTSQGATEREAFLWQRYQLSYAYSGSMLARILRDRSDPKRVRPPKTLLAFGNSDFGTLAQDAPSPPPDGRPLLADSRDLFQRGGIQPLPNSQKEVEGIRNTFPEATVYTGKQALKQRALQEGGQYRILHFATHGHYNDAAPLYSFVVLAEPPVNSSSDMFLTASDIFSQTWKADLVVLSACETGQGQKVNGEGIVGLTWALTGAGVQSAVVSQWSVSDASTSQLMQGFNRNLKAWQGKAEALQQAALSLMKDGQHTHPYYWAAFILVGDWQ